MGKLTSLFHRLATEDKALHAYFMESFPKAMPRLDKLLEWLFRQVKHPALALIMALILVILTESGKVSKVNAICAFLAWLIGFVWISRSKYVLEMTVLTRFAVIVVCGVTLAWAGIMLRAWAGRPDSKLVSESESGVLRIDNVDVGVYANQPLTFRFTVRNAGSVKVRAPKISSVGYVSDWILPDLGEHHLFDLVKKGGSSYISNPEFETMPGQSMLFDTSHQKLKPGDSDQPISHVDAEAN